MPRNLYNRVELVVPVEDPRLRGELTDVLDRCAADTFGAWDLGEDGEWRRREASGETRSVQQEMIERHAARASETSH
jgi:polyphosphate kinase